MAARQGRPSRDHIAPPVLSDTRYLDRDHAVAVQQR